MRKQLRLLFNDARLSDVLDQHLHKMYSEVDACDGSYLLNISVDDYCAYLESKYRLNAPVLNNDAIYVADHGATRVDVSQDSTRPIFDRSKPLYVEATFAEFAIPFEGDPELFKYSPSAFTFNPPSADIVDSEVRLRYTRTDHDHDALRAEFNQDSGNISGYLQWVAKDISEFNRNLTNAVQQHVRHRRDKLLKDQGMIAALGFPLKKRDNAPTTYSVSTVKRKLPIQRPVATTRPYKPEPALELVEYDHILQIISSMITVIERSPAAFIGMKEEDLRTQILVQLNGHYEGQATGETFNFDGKTDILIRVDGRNIFIAECKFWKGAESLRQTIEQLLGYTSWRDTKTAIILFNRNKDLSAVLAQIPTIVTAHPNCKRRLDYRSESSFRFVFHHRDDKNREFLLTILVFDVPS